MKNDLFITKLLTAAKDAGIDPAEVVYAEGSSFEATCMKTDIDAYNVSDTCMLGLRGVWGGRMGYASTQAFDDAAIAQLITGVKEGAELNESAEQEEIYRGDVHYPTLDQWSDDLEAVTPEAKLEACKAFAHATLTATPKVTETSGVIVGTEASALRLCNSYGLNLTVRSNLCMGYVNAVARDEGCTAGSGEVCCGRDFAALGLNAAGRKAALDAEANLHAQSVPTGEYSVILRNDAMQSLLRTFAGIFSAENTQQGLSLLAGKEESAIAAPCVTLMDAPLRPDGLASTPFDSEGVACFDKAVIEKGVLKTLLHNRKTAKKQGVATTGNASRAGMASPVRVAPTNFFFEPAASDLDTLQAHMNDGLVITELNGLHSGADPISGDFSLLASGYRVENGKRSFPVEQITVGGNFYKLLKSIVEVGSDLIFPGSGIGSPSVNVGKMSVSGK